MSVGKSFTAAVCFCLCLCPLPISAYHLSPYHNSLYGGEQRVSETVTRPCKIELFLPPVCQDRGILQFPCSREPGMAGTFCQQSTIALGKLCKIVVVGPTTGRRVRVEVFCQVDPIPSLVCITPKFYLWSQNHCFILSYMLPRLTLYPYTIVSVTDHLFVSHFWISNATIDSCWASTLVGPEFCACSNHLHPSSGLDAVNNRAALDLAKVLGKLI
jgi:hypothetical protein